MNNSVDEDSKLKANYFENEVTENEVQWRAILQQQNITENFHLLRPINPLSSSVQIKCDICSNPATLQCISCHSYWCSHEHFLLDDEPIHSHICNKLTELWMLNFDSQKGQTVELLLQNKEEGKVEVEMLEEISGICLERAEGYLADRNYIMAIAPSLRLVVITQELYGSRSYKATDAEILLAKCHLGLKKYEYVAKQLNTLNVQIAGLLNEELKRLNVYDAVVELTHSTDYLATQFDDELIKLPFLKIPLKYIRIMNQKIIELQAELYEIFGLYNQSLGVKDVSIDNLSQAVYFYSLCQGPTGLGTSLAIMDLSKTFLIGQRPVIMDDTPDVRITRQSEQVQRVLENIVFIVQIWNVVIRRQMNNNRKLAYEMQKIGDARLILQDAKAIASLYIGTASYQYCLASVTLTLLYVMYDKDYEAIIEARIAKLAIEKYCEWNNSVYSDEYEQMKSMYQDIVDVMSILETPEILKRISIIEKQSRTKI